MSMHSETKISDIPFSELALVHALPQADAEHIAEVLSPQFSRFAGDIARALGGESVEHPQLRAEALNERLAQMEHKREAARAAAEAAEAAAGAAAQTAEVAQSAQPAHRVPEQPAKHSAKEDKPRASVSSLSLREQLLAQRRQRDAATQVDENDYVGLEAEDFSAPYRFGHDPAQVVPELKYAVEKPVASLGTESGTEPDAESPSELFVDAVSDGIAEFKRHPVRIWWQPLRAAADETVLYRVVAADREMVVTPDAGETLVVTKGTAYRDLEPGNGGLRHYAIWAYRGIEIIDVVDSQPELIAETVVVYPPNNFKVAPTQGAIQATWDLLEGHTGALVYACRDTEVRNRLSPNFQVEPDPGGRKVTIPTEESGQTMVVSVRGQVEFRGEIILGSAELVAEESIKVASELDYMTLKSCQREIEEGNDYIAVQWTAPKTGEVKIYVTQHSLDPDFANRPVPRNFIDSAFSSGIIASQGQDRPGDERFDRTPWPTDWHQVYVTPVNFNDTEGWVGQSMVLQRVSPIKEGTWRLIERVDSQLITFDWPLGAEMVECIRDESETVLLREEYERQGGIRLKLRNYGETVRLRPRAIFAGEYTDAPITSVVYAGLQVFNYVLRYDWASSSVGVWIKSHEGESRMPPSFQLVFNPQRLPLHADDGQTVEFSEDMAIKTIYSPRSIAAEYGPDPSLVASLGSYMDRGGFLRLFVIEDFVASTAAGGDLTDKLWGDQTEYSSGFSTGFSSGLPGEPEPVATQSEAVIVEENIAGGLYVLPAQQRGGYDLGGQPQ